MNLNDRPTEQLLNRIAGYVKYPGLQSIALDQDVGMDEARFSHIQADLQGQAKNQVFEVCLWISYNSFKMVLQEIGLH